MHRETADDREEVLGGYLWNAAGAASRSTGQAGLRPAKDGTAAMFARCVIDARAARRKFFDSDLFADPAWDMLLELYALECEGRRISVSKLSVAAGVPCTTTLRWIDKLESESLVIRAADPLDARRMWIGLSDVGFERMRAYIEQVFGVGLPI
jgi:DNA-binding MarR family transcriptional regulator